MSAKNIRIFIEQPINNTGEVLKLSPEQSHYISRVMRGSINDTFRVFNNQKKEWLVEIIKINKKETVIKTIKLLRNDENKLHHKNIKLYFSPLKNPKRMSFLIEKAVEIGVDIIQPVITDFTQNTKKLNTAKIKLSIIEAVEQSEQLCIPQFLPAISLNDALDKVNKNNNELMFICSENEHNHNNIHKKAIQYYSNSNSNSNSNKNNYNTISVMIGPEGGFSPSEYNKFSLHNKKKLNITTVSLGDNILRAETAVIASLFLIRNIFISHKYNIN